MNEFDNIIEFYSPEPVSDNEAWQEQIWDFEDQIREAGYSLKALHRGEDIARYFVVGKYDEQSHEELPLDREHFVQIVREAPYVQGTAVERVRFSRELQDEPILRIAFPLTI